MKIIFRKVKKNSVRSFMKLREQSGENNSMGVLGWTAVVIAVVLLGFVVIPEQYEEFIAAVFAKLNDGLNL